MDMGKEVFSRYTDGIIEDGIIEVAIREQFCTIKILSEHILQSSILS